MERKSEQATANRIYDEFEPISNWKTEQGFETLTVYLPGFKKEQLKVQVTTTRKLRVMGERPSGPNKWIRFRKEFPIPSNVDVDSIAAKFEGANLVMKLPRPEPIISKQTPTTTGTTAKPPPVPKETDKVQPPKPTTRGKDAELEKLEAEKIAREKEEALKVAEKKKSYDGVVKQDLPCKLKAYKENLLGGCVTLMKGNQKTIMAGVVAPAIAVLLLSLGFYAGRIFTSY